MELGRCLDLFAYEAGDLVLGAEEPILRTFCREDGLAGDERREGHRVVGISAGVRETLAELGQRGRVGDDDPHPIAGRPPQPFLAPAGWVQGVAEQKVTDARRLTVVSALGQPGNAQRRQGRVAGLSEPACEVGHRAA